MKRVAFFIPHLGCPCRCSFCNQNSISGTAKPPTPQEVAEELAKATKLLGNATRETQIAFFGGSFTAIPKEYRQELLHVAKRYCEEYGYEGIRFSTRPDCITPAIMEELAEFPIRTIELGAQSMNDEILCANHRGHTAEQTREASRLIRQAGYGLTLQMMTNLYTDTPEATMATAEALAECSPAEVRIYPTLVLEHTHLAELYHEGEHFPWSLEESVVVSARLLQFFRDKKIAVIRLGLHQDEGLVGEVVAGPHHPAYRELCEGYLLYEKALQLLKDRDPQETSVAYVSPKDISKVKGHHGWVQQQFNTTQQIIIKVDPQLLETQVRVL